LESARDVATWKPASSKGQTNFSVDNGIVGISALLGEGDRWVYPWHILAESDRPEEGMEGIAFTLKPEKGDAVYHVMLREKGGAIYSGSLPRVQADGKPRRFVMTFDEFHWASYSPQDKNHQLDLRWIEAIAIGGNPKGPNFTYEVGDIEWVKFGK
jgi:hypothetical protein